jgi:cell division GTPase FtsZ
VLFRAGEVGKSGVGEMVVDSSEIINTLRGGGITSVGYATSEVITERARQKKGLFGGLKGSLKKKEMSEEVLTGEDKSAKIIALVRRAMLGRLTLPCDYTTSERALVLIAGPPDQMDRKGVEKSKSWVEENIAGVEVRGGDYPLESQKIAAIVVLATIGEAPRVRELMEIAKETKEDVLRSKERQTSMFEDSIEPLFE